MPILKARCQLRGDYGSVAAGETFETSEEIAEQLEAAGLVEPRVLYETKSHEYETKVIVPEAPEVRPRPPFRDVPVHHAESPPVAPESHPVLPGTDIPEPGATDPGGRRRRKGFDSI